jgi:16S rRNA (cytosine967-C5)-methyltransferase
LTPGARLLAAIEVLDTLASTRQPAEAVLKAWGVANRYAGSGDRRAIGERVFACLREQGGKSGREAVLASLAKEGKGADEIAALFSGQGYAPAPLTPEELARLHVLSDGKAALPVFVERELERTFGEDWRDEAAALLNNRAPVDLRVNGLIADPFAVAQGLIDSGFHPEPTPWSAFGLRLDASAAKLSALDAFKSGLFEVQDEGSQVAAWLLDAKPGETVVDYCAGGGGKTLAIGQMMRGQGALIACDIDPRRLEALGPRLDRAWLDADLRRIGPTGDRLEDLQGAVDRVLVDAPCSGSGVWRRRPEDAWRLTEEQLRSLVETQADILDRASALVRPGGRLVYITCSVLAAENADVVAAFAERHPDFLPLPVEFVAPTHLLTNAGLGRLAVLSEGGHTVQLSPRRTGTDGFFVAIFQRTS